MQKLLSQASVLQCAFYQQPKNGASKQHQMSTDEREVQSAIPRAWGESVCLGNVVIADTASTPPPLILILTLNHLIPKTVTQEAHS